MWNFSKQKGFYNEISFRERFAAFPLHSDNLLSFKIDKPFQMFRIKLRTLSKLRHLILRLS